MSEGGLPANYPHEWEADVVLRDGSVAHVRPIVPDDADGLQRFHTRQSEESIYLRFFAPLKRLSDKDLHRFTHVDYTDRVALVATVGEDIIGIGRYDRVEPTSAEVAFNISDHYQGRGIGSIMLEHLAAIAQELGIRRFVAEVLPQNRKMLAVFSEAGYQISRRIEDGIVNVTFDIAPTEESTRVRLAREHRAEALSMKSLLMPSSVAVIGASDNPDRVGHRLIDNLLRHDYAGVVYPVRRSGVPVMGRPAFVSVCDIPDPIDLAVIAVPADGILEVVEQCARKGVKALLVVSAGFAESGPEGVELQDHIVRAARSGGMRVFGPNSFGLINTDPTVRINASLSPIMPPRGRFGLFSQSGALGVAVLAAADRRGLGISVFASAGNRADVSSNDLMQYWIDDQSTTAVGLYVESVGNPRKFTRIARSLGQLKPVVVVSSGVPVQRGSLRPEALSAILRQAGVLQVDNLHQLFDFAQLVVNQPLPGGHRVGVVTNSGALSAIIASACRREHLEVAGEPVTIHAEASAESYREALRAMAEREDVDSIVTSFMPPVVAVDSEVAAGVRDLAREVGKPLVATFLGMHGVDGMSWTTDQGTYAVPAYTLPEDGVRALGMATAYARWRAKDKGELVEPVGVNFAAAEKVIAAVLENSPTGRELTAGEATAILAAYGISLWPAIPVSTAQQAVSAADALGYPVVVKASAVGLRHQLVAANLRLDLGDAAETREAFESLRQALPMTTAADFVVQKLASPGVPCVVRSEEDPHFGPVVSFGLAGPTTELLKDTAYRVAPLTDVDLSEMLSEIKASPLLHGYRGTPPVHRAALRDLIARVSVMADDFPELEVIGLNPVMAHAGGVDVLGAELRVKPGSSRPDDNRRTLT